MLCISHNPKVVGSNPTPATRERESPEGAFFFGLYGAKAEYNLRCREWSKAKPATSINKGM